MKRWPDVAAASTDPATERYERLVEDVATAACDGRSATAAGLLISAAASATSAYFFAAKLPHLLPMWRRRNMPMQDAAAAPSKSYS